MDNSGVSLVKCIGTFGKKKYASLLDYIKFSIKKLSKYKKRRIIKVKKNSLYKSLILTINFFIQRLNGFFIKFDIIKSITLDNNNKLISTRIKGNVYRELKSLLFENKKNSDLIRKIFLKTRFSL